MGGAHTHKDTLQTPWQVLGYPPLPAVLAFCLQGVLIVMGSLNHSLKQLSGFYSFLVGWPANLANRLLGYRGRGWGRENMLLSTDYKHIFILPFPQGAQGSVYPCSLTTTLPGESG
ncbi:UNVERIFIED_CONTAM: hypothetical protein K2H54_020402 [Gekko kuhli]